MTVNFSGRYCGRCNLIDLNSQHSFEVPSVVGPVAASRSPFSVYMWWKTLMKAFLNRDDVREAIHAESCPIAFKECTDPPFVHLSK